MDDPDLGKPPPDSLIKVLLHNDLDFLRLEGMEVDRVFDRYLMHSIQYNRPE
jgi:hypothetical protein